MIIINMMKRSLWTAFLVDAFMTKFLLVQNYYKSAAKPIEKLN